MIKNNERKLPSKGGRGGAITSTGCGKKRVKVIRKKMTLKMF